MTYSTKDPRRTASRVDARTGIREIVEFFEGDDGYLYGCRHLPPGDPPIGIVVCSPLLAELQTSYRREVLIARSLAERGFAVQRFHYRGAGNSDGLPEDATFDRLRADVDRAAQRLSAVAGGLRLGFLGTRLGGHLAAAAAAASVGSPLVIISPVLDVEAYFHEVLRGYLFGLVKEGNTAARSVRGVIADLQAKGSLDVLGYPLAWGLVESFVPRSLKAMLAPRTGPVLLVPVVREGASIDQLGDAAPATAELRPITGHDVWWFGGGAFVRQGEAATTMALVDAIGQWADRLLSGSVA